MCPLYFTLFPLLTVYIGSSFGIEQIEVGGKIRLLLARALQKKGLLAAADLKILTEAFQGVGNGSKIPSATSR